MSAVFTRTGWILCSEHPDAMMFYKSNRCPMCVELEEREEERFHAKAEAEEREALQDTKD